MSNTPKRIAVALFGPIGQGSFNESGLAGAQRAQQAFPDVPITVHWIAPREPAARADALRDLCRQGLDLLVAHGGQGDDPVSRIAHDFPDTAFAITQGSWLAANCASIEALQEHSAFLAGVLAGLASRSGVVAHLSGERVRPGLKGRAAYAHGVRESGTGCRLVTGFCGHQHDPERAYAMMNQIRSAGADMIFAMIDGGRVGVTRACREAGIAQIGNVLDWVQRDPQVFAASAIADSGACVHQAINSYLAGDLRGGTHQAHGAREQEFVRLALRSDMATQYGAALEPWIAALASGDFTPATDYAGPELDA
jgi:basic membrane protein A